MNLKSRDTPIDIRRPGDNKNHSRDVSFNIRKPVDNMNLNSRDVPTNNERPEQNVESFQELTHEIKRLNEKVNEKGIDDNDELSLSSLKVNSGIIKDEYRFKDGVTRFIESKSPITTFAKPIYTNYVEYYEDIRKRMIPDQVYSVENYMFIKREIKTNHNQDKLYDHSISGRDWNHKTTTAFLLHPKEAMKYLQLAPNKVNKKDNVWSCSVIPDEYLKVENGKKYVISCCVKIKYSNDEIFCLGCIFLLMLAFVLISIKDLFLLG